MNRIGNKSQKKLLPDLLSDWSHIEIVRSTLSNLACFVFFPFLSRWIRLLFGREFPMDDVLVLWDALFADGPMLNLVDYIYISMLEAIRDKRTVI